MRATQRYATGVATLIFAVSGISTVIAQGTATAPPRRPATSAPGTLAPGGTSGATGLRPPAGSATSAPTTGPAAGGAAAPSAARTGGTSSGGTPTVVVIDIGEVFKKHVAFNQKIDAIKKEMKDLEAWVQTEQKRVVDARGKLADYTPASPEYKKLEEEMARMQSDLQVAATLKQKSILEQEAKVYYATYVEIYKQVEEFADRYGITLVLRHSNVEVDPNKRDSVFRGLDRSIVYQRNLDITEEILSRVNRTATARAPVGGAGPNTGAVRPASGTSRQ